MRNIEQEAAALALKFKDVNRAQFARDYQVPGGDAMIYQNITGRKPISLDGAIAYAKGFGCPIADISRHWAQVVAALPLYATEPPNHYGGNIASMEAHRPAISPLQAELLRITETLSEIGIAILIGRAQEIAIHHPAQAVKKRAELISFMEFSARASLRAAVTGANITKVKP